MLINSWLDNENVIVIYNVILFRKEKQNCVIPKEMDTSRRNQSVWGDPGLETQAWFSYLPILPFDFQRCVFQLDNGEMPGN